jgi:hypothetical protein
LGDQIEKIEVGGTYSTYGEGLRCTQGFGGKTEGKETTWKTRPRKDDNIKMDLQKLELEHMNCFHMAQDRGRWRVLVNMVMNLRVP